MSKNLSERTNDNFLHLRKVAIKRTDLARVESAVSPTGADKYMRDMLDVTRVSVHRFAYAIIDNRYCNLLQYGR